MPLGTRSDQTRERNRWEKTGDARWKRRRRKQENGRNEEGKRCRRLGIEGEREAKEVPGEEAPPDGWEMQSNLAAGMGSGLLDHFCLFGSLSLSNCHFQILEIQY